jgi:hypothetical protein
MLSVMMVQTTEYNNFAPSSVATKAVPVFAVAFET